MEVPSPVILCGAQSPANTLLVEPLGVLRALFGFFSRSNRRRRSFPPLRLRSLRSSCRLRCFARVRDELHGLAEGVFVEECHHAEKYIKSR